MKLHKILGAAVVMGVTALSATSVFAADSIKLGEPFDLYTNATASELVEGHAIAIPFDFVSDTNAATSVELKVKYDNTALQAGFVLKDLSTDEKTNIRALAGGSTSNIVSDASGKSTAIVLTKAEDDFGDLVYMGNAPFIANSAYAADATYITGATASAFSVADDVDGYFLFTVVKVPEGLNTELAEIDGTATLIADDDHGKAPVYSNTTNTTDAKSNTCAGAIKIKIDGNALKDAGLYLHGLQVKVGSGSAIDVLDLIDNGDDTYSFPIRFINDSNAPITTLDGVKLIAKVAASETAETFEEKTVNLDGIALGAPTDYTEKSATIS